MAVRLLQVGVGARGKKWAGILAQEPGVQVVGWVDIDNDALHWVGRELQGQPRMEQARCFTSLDEALEETEPDAVAIITPPAVHEEQVMMSLAAGCHVLCEKPLALDLAAAKRMVEAAEAAGLLFSICLNFRYLPVTAAYRRLIQSQEFGPAAYATLTYLRDRDGTLPHLNKYCLELEDSMLVEQSIHHLDLIRFYYNSEVRAVYCETWNPDWSMYKGDSIVTALLELENGVRVTYVGSWTGGWDELKFQWRTDCPQGVIFQSDLFGDLAVVGKYEAEPRPIELPEFTPFIDDTAALIGEFAAAAAGEGPPPCTARDHLTTLALTFACKESSVAGRRVTMADFMAANGLA
ncbi:MAG: Gfo/Idh/MocA family oxidoreductase [Thermaerobacterales bacterium]